MRRHLLNAKIHRATVTEANLNYVGSISVDAVLLEAAGIVEHERVSVLNINNGERFETYAITGTAGQICLNGAAARLAQPGDRVIILTYAEFEPDEIARHTPTVVHVDGTNAIRDPWS